MECNFPVIFRPFVVLSFFQHRRSALHYAARCQDTDRRVKISETIRNAGADGDALDAVSERENVCRRTERLVETNDIYRVLRLE